MINMLIGEHYRLIGIPSHLTYSTLEGSVIRITDINREKIFYIVISGKVHNNFPSALGLPDWFHKDSDLHAFCVPVGLGKNPLPDLKPGDILFDIVYKRAYEYLSTQDIFDMTNFRYATCYERKTIFDFKKGDIVTCTDKSVFKNRIFEIKEIVNDNVICTHGHNTILSYIRHSTSLERDAFNHGYDTLYAFKSWVEREAKNRFPSPASYSDIKGKVYQNVIWEEPIWCEDELVLGANKGVVYHKGEWALNYLNSYTEKKAIYRPVSRTEFQSPSSHLELLSEEISKLKEASGITSKLRDISDTVDSMTGSSSMEKENGKIIGSPFNEKDYYNNPMNRRMDVPKVKVKEKFIYNRIKF